MEAALSRFKSIVPPAIKRGGAFAVSPLSGCADAFLALAAATLREPSVTLAVTAGIPDCERLVADLELIAARTNVRIMEFPALLESDKSSLGLRLKTLAALKAWALNPYPLIVVAPFVALSTPLPAADLEVLVLKSGSRIAPPDLAKLGYRRVPQIEQEGDFSVRGGIMDVWSPGDEFPVRAEFFADELESLRIFDAATQISVRPVSSATILPINRQSSGGSGTLFSRLPPSFSVLAFSPDEYSLPVPLEPLDLATSALPGFSGLGAEEAHHPELFEAARQKLDRHLEAAKARGTHILKLDALSAGFEIPGLAVVAKSDRVFAKRHHLRPRPAKADHSGRRLESFEELEPGEYVVHVDYGVGKYLGSQFIDRNGTPVEVFTVEYADGAKLHVPAAHAHLLSRYIGVKGMDVKLHRLDGKKWSKDKAEAQRSIRDFAAQLLSVQAKRETYPGIQYEVDSLEGLAAFEAAFPYEETPDQSAAIAAIKSDMSSPRPMDRLLCGDAGYGKTEVAMRAAFIAAMNGKQVAVLVPTTVLAEQHFETFTSRFDGTPIRIESVSRFQSSAVHSGTFSRLATGACDIVIGTHALLSPRILFKDLGLVIIDEEQRFGVRQKEFLKALRATTDILTVSATPIPRTLYLSMTGARDLSLLRSPPRERVAAETHIVPQNDETIKSAIERELASGGQVFFLHNRVSTIRRVESRLKALLPSVKITLAHGQMDTRTLAAKMRGFERGETDILLSTTIVESGIDIPRANTIIVDHAEMFGLAELYQLRGRVGRSAKQGHAYFLVPHGEGLLDSDARERLAALKRHGGLGSGFNLALRDLELRGAGNILGRKQSGHIANIGFTLYCQLLKRTIALLKGEKVRSIINVRLDLDFCTASIPYEYIEEESVRLGFLKRFAEAQDLRVLKYLGDELRDRFGPLPEEVRNFVKLSALRIRAAKHGIGMITAHGTVAKFYRAENHEVGKIVNLPDSTPDKKLAALLLEF